jgi:Cof subfamily protein (haloacid dehalogenase superfamily)
MRGVIALDIDGTVTHSVEEIAQEVIDYLNHLVTDGWRIGFITGRTFALAEHVLRVLPFAYFLAVYNGALIVQMPTREVLQRQYLPKQALAQFERISLEASNDCVIYSGWENNDQCYYRPHHFQPGLLDYAQQRQKRKRESWIGLNDFASLPIEQFPSVKYFGCSPDIDRICQRIEETLGFHAPLCHDSFYRGYGIAQVTHPLANKGVALKRFAELSQAKVTIAAGDGGNDVSMLAAADIRVVMNNAPAAVLQMAHIVAPSAEANGIIPGLTQAIAAAGF